MPHTIAEELILLAVVDMVNTLVGESVGKLLIKSAFIQQYYMLQNIAHG